MAKECQGVLFDGYEYPYRHCTEQLDTYFVYDAKGNLCFVLQPEYQKTADLSLYAFQYKYDNRNRCTWKKLPGAEYISYEYNDYDQLVCSSDSVQRSAGKKTFYAYDKFGRLTQQGERTTQTETVYLQNFYDDHIAFRAALPNDIRDQYPNDTSDNAKGSLTGTIMNVFGSSEKIYTVYYYDIKGRVIKTIENNLMGGYNTKVTTYTFTDQPATVTLTHTANGKATQTEVYTYTYDHSDRISSVSHKLNNGSTVTLASYTYDNVGRMATKKLHGSSSNQLTYAYNVRSWLTGISSGKFSQNLTYNNGSTGFNGNITAINWNANGSAHAYNFTYDGVNRLQNAVHGTGAYTERVTGYDKNGNIKALQRYNNGTLVDNLSYTYNGNQLTKVEDATGNASGFVNGASTSNEYTYDHNGNLTKDLNKNISNIQYNSLNLPSVVTFSNGNTITYLYAADGRKLRTVHVINGFSFTTDYSGNVIYENGSQKLLLTEEGYIDLIGGNAYYYYLKDHQGNNRVVVSSSGTVMETNHYYPFGGLFSTSTSVQPYKYNGKELDIKNGLNWYDYGARHYDAILGRWFVVDPLSEERYSNSAYSYTGNNPINKIDPNGMLDDWVEDREGHIYWDKNAISQATTKEGEKYLGKTVVVFNGYYDEKLGTGQTLDETKGAKLSNVIVYGPNGKDDIQTYKGYTMSSDPNNFGVVANGTYDVRRLNNGERKGPYESVWVLNNRGHVPALDSYNPAYPKRNPGYLDGVFIHRNNWNGFAGTYFDSKRNDRYSGVSEGCLLIVSQSWDKFEKQMNSIDEFKVQINRK